MSEATKPLVSAVVPTYNRAHLVSEAVDSILGQSYPNLEVIVVDDGSTDNTLEVLAKYGDRIRVIPQKNSGPAAARNHGVAESRGEYVAFLDSDDLWMPDKIRRQVMLLEAAGPDVPACLCNIRMCWSDKQLESFTIAALEPELEEGLWTNADEVLVTRFLLFNQGVMVRRAVWERLGGFDESLWILEDHEMALRLAMEGPWGFIREPLVEWRETSTGSLYQSAQRDELRWKRPLVQILEQRLHAVRGKEHARLREYLKLELSSARRQLTAATLSESKAWYSGPAARALRALERLRRALFIRSARFPKMKVQAVEISAPAVPIA